MTEAIIPDHKPTGVGNDLHGPARLELAKPVRDALNSMGAVWFLDAGTLLGAWRDQTLIPHDDDFDTAIYLPIFRGEQDLLELKTEIERTLPDPYAVRVVTSYAQKIEVYDPNSECFILPEAYYGGADFHTVCVDIQVMTDGDDDTVIYLHHLMGHINVPRSFLEPTGEIKVEGETFAAPYDVVGFLKALYGYTGADCEFDPVTKKYVKRGTLLRGEG